MMKQNETIFEYYSRPENQIIDITRSSEALRDVLFAKGWHTTPEADTALLKMLELWGLRTYKGLIPYSEIPDNTDVIRMQFHFARKQESVTRPVAKLEEDPLETIYHLSLAC